MLYKLLCCVLWLVPTTAFAYIGPGAGISAFGSLLALLATLLLAIVGFIWYPLKRLRKKFKKTPINAEQNKNERDDLAVDKVGKIDVEQPIDSK